MFSQKIREDRRIRIFAGHFGSGKTEVAVNYVLRLREIFPERPVGIADLDVVNPYFRSREKEDLFVSRDIRVVGSSIKARHGDVPAVSGEILAFLEDPSWAAVLDVGGDPEGARVLGRFSGKVPRGDYDMFLVVNARRPQTETVEDLLDLAARLEETSRLKITALVNNTHMLKGTRREDLLKGAGLLEEFSRRTGLPIRYTCAIAPVAAGLPEDVGGAVFPLELQMREDWMS